MADYQVEAVVIGAGVVGLAVARRLALQGKEVLVLERASAIGTETSSRNSEVIHAGIYYPAGSYKATLCLQGKRLLYDYLQTRGIAHERCGKLIVATQAGELAQLEAIAQRAQDAGVQDLVSLSAAQVLAMEPQVRAIAGLLSPSTGIIDSHQYMLALQADIEANGGMVVLNTEVDSGRFDPKTGFRLRLRSQTNERLSCRFLINAAGLQAGELLCRLLSDTAQAVVPRHYFAIGHYYSYSGLPPFRRLVYPTPSAGGLGIHATLDLAGQVRFGPDVRWLEVPSYEFDDSQRAAFVQAIKAYFPGLEERRLQPGYTGIRPKLGDAAQPSQDFRLLTESAHGVPGLISLHGIESPGLTASLAIAEQVFQLL